VMKFKRSTVIGIGVLVTLVTSVALAQVITGGIQARGTLGKIDAHNDGITLKSKRSTDVAVARLTFEPGSSSGWHHIEGVNVAVVQSGKLQEVHDDCDKRVHKAGGGFYEEGQTHLLRNVSNKNTVVHITFIVPSGTPTDEIIVPDDAPEGCDIE
jgi:quercetin dioxygenase-like cupin family protein